MIKLVALLIDLETKELQRAAKTIVLETPSIIILVWYSVVSEVCCVKLMYIQGMM